jgi:hypothetical protein
LANDLSVPPTGTERAADQETPVLGALVPPDVKVVLTGTDRPTVFWFQQNVTGLRTFKFSVVDVTTGKLHESQELAFDKDDAKIQGLQLATPLTVGREYSWTIFQYGPNNGQAKLGQGFVRCDAESQARAAPIRAIADLEARCRAYVDAGLWFDALAEVEGRLKSAGTSAAARAEPLRVRSGLLKRGAGTDASAKTVWGQAFKAEEKEL